VAAKPATRIADVAALAGVSPATVSRVLNDAPFVDAGLRARVQRAVATLSYRPDRVARSLRRGATATLGLIISDVQNPFFTSVVRGVERVAGSRELLVMLCNADSEPARERRYGEALIAERVAGVVIASADPAGEAVHALVSAGIPTVIVDRESGHAAVDTVFVNNRAGARCAVEHLSTLGHRRIGLICGPLNFSVARERLEGYKAGLVQADIAFDSGLVRIGDFRQASGHSAMATLLQEMRGQLDGVFVAGDLMTLGALAAIHEAELDIPADISVVGFDDMPWASALNPPLTTVAQPATAMGEIAAQLVIDRIEGNAEAPPRHVVLEPRLIVRASTAPARVRA
jgi:DNA-binding LacI/PurR family transcriptional regulator